MTEPSITELLRCLPEGVEPPPAFARAMRSRVAAELRSDTSSGAVLIQEVPIVDTHRLDTTAARRRLDPRLLVAAAVVVAAGVVGVVAFAGGDDTAVRVSDVTTSSPDPTSESDPEPDAGTEPAPVVPDPAPPVTAQVLDPSATEAVGRTFVGGSLDTFALPDQIDPYRVVATADAVWTMSLDGRLVRRDPVTLAATADLRVAAGSMLAADDTSVWVGDVSDGTVQHVDAASAEVVATVETGIGPSGSGFRSGRPGQLPGLMDDEAFARLGDLDVSDGSVWVSDLDGRLLQIDAATGELVAELPIDVDGHLVRSAGRFVLLGDQTGREGVTVLDVTTGEVVAELEVEWLVGADLTTEAALVFDQSGVVSRIDLASGRVQESPSLGDVVRTNLEVPYFAHRPAVSAAGFVLTTRAELVVVDPATLEVVRRDPVRGDRGELAIGPDGTAWIVEHTADVIHRLRSQPR